MAGASPFRRLSVPGALTVWSEWWAWEVAVLMAGWLCAGAGAKCSALVVQPALGNTMVMGFMVKQPGSVATVLPARRCWRTPAWTTAGVNGAATLLCALLGAGPFRLLDGWRGAHW